MNRDDIIRMARDSGMELYGLGKDREKFVYYLQEFAALVAAAERERLLPKEPPPGLLMSMAVRYDHGLGMPGYYDHAAFDRFDGDSHAKRLDGALSIMRQLYEEVSRNGFYSDEREHEYAAIRARRQA